MANPNSFWSTPLFWGIRLWQLLVFLLLFGLNAVAYNLILWLTSNREVNPWQQTLINFGTKVLCLLPIYGLFMVRWKNWPIRRKVLLHLLFGPLFIVGWLWVYHRVADYFGVLYLTGNAMLWDIYIPLQLYIVIFAVFHSYEYYTDLQKQRLQESELRQLAMKANLSALKAQVQPHFLFNTLNSISASVPPDMEKTRVLIAQLADTFRFGLLASRREWVPLREEIQFLHAYLQLEKERFRERLDIRMNIGPDCLDANFPPLLLQPLVENALQHGLAPSINGGNLEVNAKKQNSRVYISVSDSGNGHQFLHQDEPPETQKRGIGLGNTEARLEQLFGEKLVIGMNESGGWTVSFSIPYTQYTETAGA